MPTLGQFLGGGVTDGPSACPPGNLAESPSSSRVRVSLRTGSSQNGKARHAGVPSCLGYNCYILAWCWLSWLRSWMEQEEEMSGQSCCGVAGRGVGVGLWGVWGWRGPEGDSLLISPSRPASIKPSSVPVWVLGRRVCLPALFAFSWFREYVSGCPLPVSAPRFCFPGSWGCPRKCALREERCPKLAFERRLPCVGWWLFFHPSQLRPHCGDRALGSLHPVGSGPCS